jgi:hypothetical protein
MGKYGRPKSDPSKRRDAARINVRLNYEERIIVEEKARDAGVKPHAWARLAALERHPPVRPIVPEINREAWLETGKLMATLKGAIWRFQPGMEDTLRAMLEGVKEELTAVRKLLVGGDKP